MLLTCAQGATMINRCRPGRSNYTEEDIGLMPLEEFLASDPERAKLGAAAQSAAPGDHAPAHALMLARLEAERVQRTEALSRPRPRAAAATRCCGDRGQQARVPAGAAGAGGGCVKGQCLRQPWLWGWMRGPAFCLKTSDCLFYQG